LPSDGVNDFLTERFGHNPKV